MQSLDLSDVKLEKSIGSLVYVLPFNMPKRNLKASEKEPVWTAWGIWGSLYLLFYCYRLQMNFVSVRITQNRCSWDRVWGHVIDSDHIAFTGRLQHSLKRGDDMPACPRCHQEHTEILASGTICGLCVLRSISQALCGAVSTRQNLLCSLGW